MWSERKNRKPIEERGKLPQFTTMNVIEGHVRILNKFQANS